MKVRVDGVDLWFEVLGAKRRVEACAVHEVPTVISVHGGPGTDSFNDLEFLSTLSSFAQVVVYDQRGHGLSSHDRAENWNLDTWADDVVRLSEALGIKRPIVMGASFGGFVIQRYAARHPGHASGLVLLVTAPRMDEQAIVARFRDLGGAEAAEVARRDFEHSTEESGGGVRRCVPSPDEQHPRCPQLSRRADAPRSSQRGREPALQQR